MIRHRVPPAAAIGLVALIALSACSTAPPSDSAASPSATQPYAETATPTPPATPTPTPTPTPTSANPEKARGTVEGTWCPTKQSNAKRCLTVKLPKVTYDDGSSYTIVGKPFRQEDGGLQYSFEGAPFGAFYAAGTKIDIPDHYSGADLPQQDRIWNAQTGDLFVREQTG
jgi:hypothetical protein